MTVFVLSSQIKMGKYYYHISLQVFFKYKQMIIIPSSTNCSSCDYFCKFDNDELLFTYLLFRRPLPLDRGDQERRKPGRFFCRNFVRALIYIAVQIGCIQF